MTFDSGRTGICMVLKSEEEAQSLGALFRVNKPKDGRTASAMYEIWRERWPFVLTEVEE